MEQSNKKAWWRDALVIFARVSIWIAIPIVCALFIGKALDAHYHTKPWLFLVSMALGFITSLVGIYRTMIKEVKKIDKGNGN
jgi:F0F1-type ATP synthase assembly protein I